MIYLDYNATASMPEAVVDAMTAAARLRGNPSSVHADGRAARAIVEAARRDIAALVGASPTQVVFTSGATEANALALRGSGRRRVLAAASEHDSVLRAVDTPELVPVGADGRVCEEDLATALGADGADTVVSVMLANNETGILQDIPALAACAASAGALFHCDAVQAPGRIPIDFAALGVDLLSLSAHKFGGPKGVGALIVRDGLVLTPVIRGGGQERGLRGGTENVTGIAGFGAAAKLARERLDKAGDIAALRDRLETESRAAIADAVVIGGDVPRLPNTSCLAVPGLSAETQVMALDLAGVAVSAGSACSSGKVKTSHVLLAMDLDESIAGSAIRVSLGPETTSADVDAFLAAWTQFVRQAHRSAA